MSTLEKLYFLSPVIIFLVSLIVREKNKELYKSSVFANIDLFYPFIVYVIHTYLLHGMLLVFPKSFIVEKIGIIKILTIFLDVIGIYFLLSLKKIKIKTLLHNNNFFSYFIPYINLSIFVFLLLEVILVYFTNKWQSAEIFLEAPTLYYMKGGGIVLKLIVIFDVILIGPICEEILFRGFIYTKFKMRYDSVTSIILSSILFAISHNPNSIESIGFIPLGIFFNYLYEKTNYILIPIIAHVVYNFLLTIINFYAMLYYEKIIKLVPFNFFLFYFIILTLIIVLLEKKYKKIKENLKE